MKINLSNLKRALERQARETTLDVDMDFFSLPIFPHLDIISDKLKDDIDDVDRTEN